LFGLQHHSAPCFARPLRLLRVVLLLLLVWVRPIERVTADDLAQRIDSLLQQSLAVAQVAPGPVSSDAEFCRRVTLDLAGRIPTVAELSKFLSDPDPQRRVVLVDRLLDSPEHSRRMADLFHVMLMERRGDHPEWTLFLRTSFAQQKPWEIGRAHV
jgi:hypothetical protein